MNDTLNTPQNIPAEAPVEKAPEAAAAPEAPVAPAAAATAVPAVAVKMEIPVTKGTTPGGWNRFAGYNRNDAKNNKTKGPSKRF